MPARRYKYDEALKFAIANGKGVSARALQIQVEAALAAQGVPEDEFPSEATISRRRRELSESDLVPYHYLAWPTAMQAGLLPWAASQSVLALLGAYQSRPGDFRPTIRTCRWYWDLTQGGAAGLPDGVTKRKLARRLAALEATGEITPDLLGAVEALLAAGSISEYVRRVQAGLVPAWDWITAQASEAELSAASGQLAGEFDVNPDELQEAIVRAKATK